MEKAQEKYNQVMQIWSLGMLKDPNHSRLIISYPSGESEAKKIALQEARKIDSNFNKMEDGGLVFNEADELHNAGIIKDAEEIDDWIFSQKWSEDDGTLATERSRKLEEFTNKYGVTKGNSYVPDEMYSKYITVDNDKANQVVEALITGGYSWDSFEALESGDKTNFALSENQYNKIKDKLEDMDAVIDKYENGGSIKHGDKEAVATMDTADGLIDGTVKWNPLWNKFQVSVDGVILGEFNTLEDGIEELENSGFKNVSVQDVFVSSADSTKKEMEGRTQQYRINALIERIKKSFQGINEVKESDGIVQTHAEIYDLEPRRVASLFNEYRNKTNTDNFYMKDGGQVVAITDEAEWKKRNTLEKIEILSEHMPPKNAMEMSRMSYSNVMKSPWLKNKLLTFRPVETKTFKIGDNYSSDFDYEGMLKAGLETDTSWSAEKLKKLHGSFADVNYHGIARPLWGAVFASSVEAKKHSLDEFHKLIKEELKDFEDEPSENETDVEIVKLQSVIDSDLVPAHIKEMAKALIEKKTTVSETVLETVPEPETESAAAQYKKSLESLNMLIELADDEAEKATYKKSIESLNMLLEMEGDTMSEGGSLNNSKDGSAYQGGGEIIEIDEDGSNLPEALHEIFGELDEDADPYEEMERLRVLANEKGYDFDYGLDGAPTEFWELDKMSKGGSVKKFPIAIERKINDINKMLPKVLEADDVAGGYHGGTMYSYVELTNPIETKGKYVYLNAKKGNNQYPFEKRYNVNDTDEFSINGRKALMQDLNVIKSAFKKLVSDTYSEGGETSLSEEERARLDELQAKEDLDNLNNVENEEYETLVEKYRNTKGFKDVSAHGNSYLKGLMKSGTKLYYKSKFDGKPQPIKNIEELDEMLGYETILQKEDDSYSKGGSVKVGDEVYPESLSGKWKVVEIKEKKDSTGKTFMGGVYYDTVIENEEGERKIYPSNRFSNGGNVDWTPTKETFFSWMSSKVEANKKVVKLKKENKGQDFKVVKVGHGDYEIHTK